jgi:UPF0716 family protein affecting phage T7 exclusion
MGQGTLGGVPMQLVFFVLVAAAGWALLARTGLRLPRLRGGRQRQGGAGSPGICC